MNLQMAKSDINHEALDWSLRDSLGVLVTGIGYHNGIVTVHLTDAATPADIATATTIVTNHDPEVLSPEQIREQEIAAVEAEADTIWQNLPQWATWTTSEAEAWIDANVTNLASAKVVLIAMMKAIFALRNQVRPELQGE